jgi:hypothetical protein
MQWMFDFARNLVLILRLLALVGVGLTVSVCFFDDASGLEPINQICFWSDRPRCRFLPPTGDTITV